MIRTMLLLVAMPIGSAVAQSAAIRFTITSPDHAAFRIVHPGLDSVAQPLFARGRLEVATHVAAPPGGFGERMEVTALDTTTAVHIEATQNGRVIASGDGVYLTVRRDADGVVIEARSRVPTAVARALRVPD